MTDRELLELAAKAAGIQYEWHPGCGDALHLTAPDATAIYWNPLSDDGDALRLAVKLHMSVLSNEHASWVATGMHQIVRAEEHHDGADPYAATRRAIVRAAAEIGKGLK
jgi:hypothetical protein